MTVHNGHSGPTETSPLLSKDISTSSENSPDPLPDGTSQTSSTRLANGAQTDGAGDDETGEIEESGNPIFEGLPEVVARLHILVPAVAIGVSTQCRFIKHINL